MGSSLSFDRSQVTEEMRAVIAAANPLDSALLAAGTALFEQRKVDFAAAGRWEDLAPFEALVAGGGT